MPSPTTLTAGRPRFRLVDRPGLVRARLWSTMLGLALLPMVGVIVLTTSLTEAPRESTTSERAWQTSTAVAELTARQQQVESRVLGVASDSDVQRLVDGISGAAERGIAAGVVSSVEASTRGLVRGACLTRTLDGSRVVLTEGDATRPVSSACGGSALVARVLASPPGSIVRTTARGVDGNRRILLATALAGTTRRNAAVLSVEVGARELFRATPAAADVGGAALLVDMDSSEIVASERAEGVVDGSASSSGRALGNLRIRVNGIVSSHLGTARVLESAGWVATAAPVWSAVDGADFGIVHLWPVVPAPSNTLLVAALAGFILLVLVIAVVLARTFLQPFRDLAESQSQLEVLYREAREDSLHDGLTGLGNHRSFQEELDRQLDLFRRHKVPVALLLIDLDDLKVVNDGEGHPAGDRLLVGMANAIRDALRYGDRAFRIGGDEFAVILPHTNAPEALIAANRLRHFCLRPAAGERVIPFSGGISSVPLLAMERNELFRQADAALYRCKRQGRGTVEIFDADRDQVPDDPASVGAVAAVRDVIRGRQLTPVYQPIVDLRDGSVLGFEGLIRPAPPAPFSNPGQLFATAAAAGRTVELDLACFEVVVAGAREISPEQVITINLSPQTLEVQGYTSSWLLEVLMRYQISPGRVIVELTEREAISDLDRLRQNVATLQQAGVRVAADDVGAGNAGLRLLSQLRFDIVKIDLSLVQDGAQHDSSRAVVRSLMDLAMRQGAVAIAEGLETADQLRSLRDLGMTTGQGYLLGRPGLNLGLRSVDIEALAAGTLVLENAPAPRPPRPGQDSSDALQGSSA